jgi:hypothetical protein
VEGGVDTANNLFRARVQYSENGHPHVIRGPSRSSDCQARADLECCSCQRAWACRAI